MINYKETPFAKEMESKAKDYWEHVARIEQADQSHRQRSADYLRRENLCADVRAWRGEWPVGKHRKYAADIADRFIGGEQMLPIQMHFATQVLGVEMGELKRLRDEYRKHIERRAA